MVPLPQPPWITIPCTFISVLIASTVTKAMMSPKDKGLTTVLKAVCIFLLVLALTFAVANTFLPLVIEDTGPNVENPTCLANDLRNVERRDFDAQFATSSDDRVAKWRDSVREDTDLVAEKKRRIERARS
jgi:hypothetical protein